MFHQIYKILRALRKIQYLLLIRELSATHGHTFEERFYFRERERIPLQNASVPDMLGEHSAKAENDPFARGTGKLPRDGISIPLKA
jgi:hypothetical protein